MDILFYDIETYSHDAIAVLKTAEKKIFKIFHNTFEGLNEIVRKYTLTGYNNYHYDDKMISAMIDGYSPRQLKKLNDEIIIHKKNHPIKPHIKSLDCFQQIDVSFPGLKKIEGNMGLSIVETPVSFDIDRELTPEELEQVIAYCSYDVDVTIDVYFLRQNYFTAKEALLQRYGNPKAVRWNTTTISAKFLLDKPLPKWSSIRVEDEYLDMVPREVKEFWLKASRDLSSEGGSGSLTIDEFDNEITFAFGGLHGAHKRIKDCENVKLLDVTSMYPHIIIKLNVLGGATSKYKSILQERIAIKHKDKQMSEALKLILNSVYGNLNSKYSLLHNPKGLMSVCVYGQIALYKLAEMINPFVTIVNINTDGIAFIPHDEQYKKVVPEWEKIFDLNLEEDEYDRFIQKDVNNYIAIKDGEIVKAIGAHTKRHKYDAFFKNNNARILDIALVQYLVHGKDVIETIMDHIDQPKLFQYILQAGPTYKGTADRDKNLYQKINRVFASKKGNFCLQKLRADDGLVMFADVPERMLLWNDCLSKLDLEEFRKNLDINHYYQIILKRLEGWK